MAAVAGAGAVGLSLAFAPFAACGGNAFTAGTSEDSGPPDSGPPPAVDAGHFCASLDAATYPFCSDFDEKPLPENWDSVVTPGTATLAEDDAGFSPPNALLAFAPGQALLDGGTNEAFVTKTGLPHGGVHIAFEVRVDELKFPSGAVSDSSVIVLSYTQGKVYQVIVAFTPPATSAAVSLVLIEIVEGIDGGVSGTAHSLDGLVASADISQWLPMQMDFDIDDTVGLTVPAQVTLGSTSVQLSLTPPLGTALGDRSLTIGAEAVGQVDETRIHYDNVTYSALK
jgi:hypothetical protein